MKNQTPVVDNEVREMEKEEMFNIAGREEFEYIMRMLGKCTDDYLFFFDLDGDYYCISDEAAKRFH